MNRHLVAINAGTVTRSNVIGLRKALNANARRERGLSASRTCPTTTAEELEIIQAAIAARKPSVAGDLHETGLKALRNPRYAKRLGDVSRVSEFRLAGFEWIDDLHAVALFEAHGKDHRGFTTHLFTFRNVAWQSGGNGPEITEDLRKRNRYLEITPGGFRYAVLRVGVALVAPNGVEVYFQPGDDTTAILETIEALEEIPDDKRAAVAAMALGEYFA